MSKTSRFRICPGAVVAAWLGLNAAGLAQQPAAAPAPAPAAAPAPAPAPAGVPAPKPDSPDATALDYLYNRKPQEGTAAAAAAQNKMRADDKTRALDALAGSDSPLEPEFEQFLNAAEADPVQLRAYLANYGKVMSFLLNRQPADAYHALFAMGAYEGDSGISRQLANRVQTVWDASNATRGLLADNERLKEQVKQSSWNVDQYAESADRNAQERAAERQRSRNRAKNNNPPPAAGASPAASSDADDTGSAAAAAAAELVGGASSALVGKMRMTDEFLRSMDGKARLKYNELKIKTLNDRAKTEFSDYIGTLFKSGRLLHAVAATDFYRVMFQDGSLPPGIANQADAASEIVGKVGQAVDVVRFKVDNNQLSAGSAILREAFKLDPDHPALQGLLRTKKLLVANYYSNLKKLQNLIEAREFGPIEPLITEIEKTANDFDATKALALVNAVKLESRMHLGQAKIAAQMGDQQKALDEFKSAAAAWPGNPDLATASNGYFESQDNKNKGVTEFDRAIKEGNYRLVADNQLPFMASVKGDPERERRFKDALTKVRDAEVATEKADLLARNGDSCGAWEALEAAAKNWPDDGKLNKARAEMSIKAAEFVSAVSKAQEAETRKELGYSLTLYVQAQRRYPASQLANEAIDRLKGQILGTKPLASNP